MTPPNYNTARAAHTQALIAREAAGGASLVKDNAPARRDPVSARSTTAATTHPPPRVACELAGRLFRDYRQWQAASVYCRGRPPADAACIYSPGGGTAARLMYNPRDAGARAACARC